MQYFKDFTDPTSLHIITEAGLRAFDRYHRNRDDKMITLAASDWHRVDDDQTPPSAAQVAP